MPRSWASDPFDQIDDVSGGVGAGHLPGTRGQLAEGARIAGERQNFARQTLAGALVFGEQARSPGLYHFLGIAQLMAVGGGPERNEEGGATGGGDLRNGDGART